MHSSALSKCCRWVQGSGGEDRPALALDYLEGLHQPGLGGRWPIERAFPRCFRCPESEDHCNRGARASAQVCQCLDRHVKDGRGMLSDSMGNDTDFAREVSFPEGGMFQSISGRYHSLRDSMTTLTTERSSSDEEQTNQTATKRHRQSQTC